MKNGSKKWLRMKCRWFYLLPTLASSTVFPIKNVAKWHIPIHLQLPGRGAQVVINGTIVEVFVLHVGSSIISVAYGLERFDIFKNAFALSFFHGSMARASFSTKPGTARSATSSRTLLVKGELKTKKSVWFFSKGKNKIESRLPRFVVQTKEVYKLCQTFGADLKPKKDFLIFIFFFLPISDL